MPFIYDETIPAANNNPSSDQPVMQANALAITQLIAVDHVTFNSADSGKHEQVTFVDKNTPGAQTDPQSVLYTANGTANTRAELKFVNQSGTFPVSLVKAYGLFTIQTTAGGAPATSITTNQSVNILSATGSNTGAGGVTTFVITLNGGVTTGANVGILLSIGWTFPSSEYTYSFTSPALSITIANSFLISPIKMTVLFTQL